MSLVVRDTGSVMELHAAEALRRTWPGGWEPRQLPRDWSQTCQNRQDLTACLDGYYLGPDGSRTRVANRRRGLKRLLDWLERQPGSTWQERWLSSGADEAGIGWPDLLLGEDAPRDLGHIVRAGVSVLIWGQAIRPTYPWLLVQRQPTMLAEARRVIDSDGFARLRALRLSGHNLADALNRITWIVVHKGGRVEDITVGDCVELVAALNHHSFRGSAGRPLFYALLVESGILPANAPPRLRALLLPTWPTNELVPTSFPQVGWG